MSLFQCGKCGCEENTALSTGYWVMTLINHEAEVPSGHDRVVIAEWREILGLKPGEKFGVYCSVCSPIWYGSDGSYGIGPNPVPPENRWHNRFKRDFLPKGEYETGRSGDLQHKKTKEPPDAFYRDTEWPEPQEAV